MNRLKTMQFSIASLSQRILDRASNCLIPSVLTTNAISSECRLETKAIDVSLESRSYKIDFYALRCTLGTVPDKLSRLEETGVRP